MTHQFICLQTDTGNCERSVLRSQNYGALMTNQLSALEISSAFHLVRTSISKKLQYFCLAQCYLLNCFLSVTFYKCVGI